MTNYDFRQTGGLLGSVFGASGNKQEKILRYLLLFSNPAEKPFVLIRIVLLK